MNSYDSVVAFASHANQLGHLDIAILHASVRRDPFTLSSHGCEEDLQVNILSTTLPGILLLPKLHASKPHTGKTPVLQLVNLGLHQTAIIPPALISSPSILAAYNDPQDFSAQNQYAHSKLLLMYTTNALAATTSPADVIVTSVCPGMVSSNLARDVKVPGINVLLAVIGFFVMRAPEQAANTYVSGAVQDANLHGAFWKNDAVQSVAGMLVGEENREVGRRVWAEVKAVLEKEVEAVKEVLGSIRL